MNWYHCLTSSRASHDCVRAPLSDSFAPEPLDSVENLPASQLSISLDSLAGPVSISSLSAAAITSSARVSRAGSEARPGRTHDPSDASTRACSHLSPL